MTTPTTHFALGKPVVGGDADTWGSEVNTALDAIDTGLGGASGGWDVSCKSVTTSGGATVGGAAAVTGVSTLTGGAQSGSFTKTSGVTNNTFYTAIAAGFAAGSYRIFVTDDFNVAPSEYVLLHGVGGTITLTAVVTGSAVAQLDGSNNFQIKTVSGADKIGASWLFIPSPL